MGVGILTTGVVCIALVGCAQPRGGADTAVRSSEPSDYQKMVDCSSRSEAVRKLEKEDNKDSGVQVFSHWNRALQKCFAKLEVTRGSADGRRLVVTTTVLDAYEGRVYLDWFRTIPREDMGLCDHFPLGAPPEPQRTAEACEAKILEYFDEWVRPEFRSK